MKDYYVILGIQQTASANSVRRAYRAFAKRFHPDSGLVDDDAPFRELVEAYAVLSDQYSRAEYDRARGSTVGGRDRPTARPAPRAATAPHARPGRAVHEMPPVDRTRRPRPSPPVHAEIVVSPVEAEHGGTMYVRVPLGAPCPGCAGTGGGWPPACCATCAGSGVVPDDVDLRIHIPPRIRDGAVLEIPIAEATHRAVRLRALVRVGG